jgi:hypothetical protein
LDVAHRPRVVRTLVVAQADVANVAHLWSRLSRASALHLAHLGVIIWVAGVTFNTLSVRNGKPYHRARLVGAIFDGVVRAKGRADAKLGVAY